MQLHLHWDDYAYEYWCMFDICCNILNHAIPNLIWFGGGGVPFEHISKLFKKKIEVIFSKNTNLKVNKEDC